MLINKMIERLRLMESRYIGLSDVSKWKKDLRKLTKIYRDIKPDQEDEKITLEKFLEAKRIYRNFRDNFEKWVYVGILGMPHEDGLPRSHPYWKKETLLMASIRETAYTAVLELGRHDMFPDRWNYKVDKHLPAPWELSEKRKKSIIRKYQKPFNKVFKAIEDFLKHEGGEVQSKMSGEDRINISGFPVIIKTFATDSEKEIKHIKEVVDSLRVAFSILEKRANRVYPRLIKQKIPIVYDREFNLNVAAEYCGVKKIITLKRTLDIKKPKVLASILAHELGHHIFKTVLSEGAIKFWSKALSKNYGKLDVNRVLKLWKDPKEYSFSFTDRIANTNPDLSLQLLAYFIGYTEAKGISVNTRDDFIKATKDDPPGVMKNPITAYAHKNPEEAFCEALSMYIIYGSRAVYPIVRKWLKIVLPEIRMNESVAREADKIIEELNYIIEARGNELFHTTSHKGLLGILKEKRLKPKNIDNPFVSFSEVPYFGDISGNDAVLVFNRNKIKGQLIRVEYNEDWYNKYTDQASYIAGEGWREQFNYDDWIDPNEYDEDGWIDPEVEEEAYREAEIQAFLDKDGEREWITKKEMQSVKFQHNDIRAILVKKSKINIVKDLVGKLNTDIQVRVLK